MTINLTYAERMLLDHLLQTAVRNGNTVNPAPYVPTPKEYLTACAVYNKIGNKLKKEDD